MSRQPIRDHYTAAPISRQRKWALRNRDLGLCMICSEPVVEKSSLCEKHRNAKREYQAAWRAAQQLKKELETGKKAKRGRPKKIKTEEQA